MKILHLLPYVPTPPNFGGALRIFHILKHLQDNHDVTVAGFSNSGDPEAFYREFPALKNKTHFLTRPWKKRFRRLVQIYSLFTEHSYWYNTVSSKAMQRKIEDLSMNHEFDIIQSEFPSMGFFNLPDNATRILDAHNVEYDNFRRMADMEWSKLRKLFYRREYTKLHREEIKVCRDQDAVFTTSERDKELLDKETPEVPKYVVPNGVDLSFFHPLEEEPEPYSLVFTGMMGYVPNYDGMLYFLDEIFPRIQKKMPQVKVYIVGKSPPKILKQRATDKVIVTGFVEDVRPYVWRSSVYVVPLRMGGGTRLKVLEALSMKKPVVSTPTGCEGIDVDHGKNIVIAKSPAEFAESVIRFLLDYRIKNKFIQNGYDLVKNRYDWNVIGEYIEEAYSTLTGMDANVHEKQGVLS